MLSTSYHDTTEYPGLASSTEQLARAFQRYHFASLMAGGKRVLEVACGAGLGLGYLARSASMVIGGDIDRLNLAATKRTYNGTPRVSVVGMDAHRLPFPDASFDLVLLFEAVYYLKDPRKFIKEAARVLRPDGALVIACVNGEWPDLHPSPNVFRYYSSRELSELIRPYFGNVALYGGFPTPHDRGSELVSFIKKCAVRLHWIPGTLAGRALLKRVVFGKLSPMPAVIAESSSPYFAPARLRLDCPTPEFKILFSVANGPIRPAPAPSARPAERPGLAQSHLISNSLGLSFDPATPTFFRGRVALYAILKALGVGRGDEVAVAAYTCVAVAEGILALGARPVWIDVKAGGLNLDPDHAEDAINSRTKALVVQHTFGIPADMDRIMEIAGRRGIPVIEDCCHTFQSTYKGRRIGEFGAAAFYSFEWGKPLVVGVGGAAVCRDPELRRRLAALYADFKDPSLARDLRIVLQYYGFLLGYRPSFYWLARSLNTTLSRAGLAESSYHTKLGEGANNDFRFRMAHSCRDRLLRHFNRLDAVAAHSEWVCEQYRAGIRNPGVRLKPAVLSPGRTVLMRYPLWVSDKPRIMAAARKAGVEIAGWYQTPIHPLGPSEWDTVNYRAGSCPNAERATGEVVTLPTRIRCTAQSIERAIKLINGLQL